MGRGRVIAGIGLGCALLLAVAVGLAGALIWWMSGRFSPPTAGGPTAGVPAPQPPAPAPVPELMSQPADPWSQAHVAPQGTLAFMPLLTDGVMTFEGRQLAVFIAEQWNIALPDDVALANTLRLANALADMSPYSDTRSKATPEGVAAIVKFAAATHWMEGTLTMTDTEWIVEATFHAKGETHQRRFAAPKGEHFALAAAIAPWTAELSGFELTPKFRGELATLPYGPDVRGDLDPVLLAMVDNPDHPKWRELMDGPNATPHIRLQYLRVLVQKRRDEALFRESDPGPLPLDAEPWQRKSRWFVLKSIDELPTARHEAMILLARNPGQSVEAARLFFDSYRGSERDAEYIATARRWHGIATPSPIHDAWLGNVYTLAAWANRGGGYSNTVSQSGAQRFEEYHGEAIKLFEKVFAEAGPIPWVGEQLCDAYGSTGQREKMLATHRATVAAFPDYYRTWDKVLWYSLPRWGGSIDQVADLIDEALAGRPDNARFGRLPFTIYQAEAGVLGRGNLAEQMEAVCAANPRVRPQLDRGIGMMGDAKAGPRDAVHALVAMMVLRYSEDDIHDLVRRHPDIHRFIGNNLNAAWSGRASWEALIAHANMGNWRSVDEIVQDAVKNDPRNRTGNREGRVIMRTPKWDLILRAYAAIMNGRETEGMALLDQIQNPDFDLLVNITFLKLYADRADPEVRAHCDAAANAKPDDSDYAYIAALAALRAGDQEAARAWAEKGDAIYKTDQSESIRREVRRLVLGIDEPRPEDIAPAKIDDNDEDPAEEDPAEEETPQDGFP